MAKIIEIGILTHSLIHSLTYSLTHSLTHLLTYLLTHLLTHSLTHLLTYSTHSLTHLLNFSVIEMTELYNVSSSSETSPGDAPAQFQLELFYGIIIKVHESPTNKHGSVLADALHNAIETADGDPQAEFTSV